MTRIFVLLIAVVLASGCATQTFNLNGGAGAQPDAEKMQNFFVAGLAQEQEIDAAEICGGPDKVAKVEAHLRFVDGFLAALTYGIYTPRTVRVYCTS